MTMISIAAVFLFTAVVLGAFGAHALGAALDASGHAPTWETAVQYQVSHGLGLLAVGIWLVVRPPAGVALRLLRAACRFWIAGVLLFSGSLYLLALGAPRWLGAITPMGGVCFLAGWLLLAIGAWRPRSSTVSTHDPS